MERLDEKLLSQYSPRYDFNTTRTSFLTPRKIFKKNTGRKQENSVKLFKKIKLRRRIQKIRCLCFNNDESAGKSDHKKFFIETMAKDAENKNLQRDDNFISSEIDKKNKTSENLNTKEVSCYNNSSENLPKWKNNSETEIECCEISSKNISSKSKNENSCHKNEIIQEITKPCAFQEEMNSIKEALGDTSENVEHNFENEYNIRENKVDENTIIFKGSPGQETNSGVFKINKRKIKNPTKKFRTKEKMNLTNSDDLEVLKKIEILNEENLIGEDVKRLDSDVIDYYFQKLCILVNHFYELGIIILQMKKKFPDNNELAFHFIKVIKAEKENFFNEIDKSQKIVIEYYKKLLAFHGNSTNEVISKVSERAFLKAEIVSKIISQCFLANEVCNGKKSNEKNEEQNNLEEPKISDCPLSKVNENLLKLMEVNKITPQSHFPSPSENFKLQKSTESKTSIQKPSNESVIPSKLSKRKKKNHSEKSSDLAIKSFLPSYDNYEIWKRNSPTVRAQHKNQYQVVDSKLRQPSPTQDGNLTHPGPVSRHSNSFLENNQPLKIKIRRLHSEPNKPTTTSTFCTIPTANFLYEKRPCAESSAPKPSFLHTTPPNDIQQKSASQESILSNFSYPAQNISSSAVCQKNNLERCSFVSPSNKPEKVINTLRQALKSFRASRPPSEDFSVDLSRFLNQKPSKLIESSEEISGKHSIPDPTSRRESQNTSGGVPQEVLDPTLPQTMKNCQLQPEPSLGQKTDGKVLEAVKTLDLET